jgi:hypothetical protein
LIVTTDGSKANGSIFTLVNAAQVPEWAIRVKIPRWKVFRSEEVRGKESIARM